MLKASDFILNPRKMETNYQLVEVNEWKDYETKKPMGFFYIVLFPKLQYEKVKVGIKADSPIITNEELKQFGTIPVEFDNLEVTAVLYEKRFSAKGTAKSIKRLDTK